MPQNRKEALHETFETQLQMHTTGRQSVGGQGMGERVGMFHGHGSSADETKDIQFRFCREVNRALSDKIKHDTAPLVLAAVDYLHPIYREANTYPHLLEQGVIGNPELWKEDEMLRQAWTVVGPHFYQEHRNAAARYDEMKAAKRSTANPREIIAAAHFGRVDTLFVAVGVQQWGTFDSATGAIDVHTDAEPNDVDLLDAAATQTLLNNGIVYAVEPGNVPDGGPIAAIFRY